MRRLAVLYAAFAALALATGGPALRGEFLSDDVGYLVANPYVQSLSLENLRLILDPWGEAAHFTANYAPVHLLASALTWAVFGASTFGHHLVSVLGHALASLLLVPLLLRAGLPLAVAVFGGLFFLLHPANVEASAWISQLKTILCLVLATGAVLLHPRRPLAAAALFALALLSKASAAFALPAAAYFAWRRSRLPEPEPARWGWLAAWGLALALYAAPQLLAFEHLGETQRPPDADPFETVRTAFAIGARYVALATTSYGAAAFHHPPPARSLLDPWWLAGLALSAGAAVRLVATALRRREEAGFWIWAAAAYVPVSQVFPFLYPMADRYLYVVLPGLIGAVCLAATAWAVPRTAGWSAARKKTLRGVYYVTACGILVIFAARSLERAAVFRSNTTLMLDSARRYPDGLSASLLGVRRAAVDGDAAAVAKALHRATELGYDSFFALDAEPALASVRSDPRVRAAVAEMAGRWIDLARQRGYSAPHELQLWARAHSLRDEWGDAAAVLEKALEHPGPLEADLRRALAEVRRQQARHDASPPQ